MKVNQLRPDTIDAYIASFPEDIQDILEQLRSVIRDAAPAAKETISYSMPAFALHGILVYFAACKKHIGFYPTSSGMQTFQEELSAYGCSKGAVRFPLDEPLPLDLIRRVVEFRVAENLYKAAVKRKPKE
jgi:uncharacterized protein YdhG (YjbR/CyaY superfamily)